MAWGFGCAASTAHIYSAPAIQKAASMTSPSDVDVPRPASTFATVVRKCCHWMLQTFWFGPPLSGRPKSARPKSARPKSPPRRAGFTVGAYLQLLDLAQELERADKFRFLIRDRDSKFTAACAVSSSTAC